MANPAGRPKGSKNRITREMKSVMESVLFDDVATTKTRLLSLRDSNEATDRRVFWSLAGKMIPTATSVDMAAETRLHVVDLSDRMREARERMRGPKDPADLDAWIAEQEAAHARKIDDARARATASEAPAEADTDRPPLARHLDGQTAPPREPFMSTHMGGRTIPPPSTSSPPPEPPKPRTEIRRDWEDQGLQSEAELD